MAGPPKALGWRKGMPETGLIEVRALGGPEVLNWAAREAGVPGPGEVLVRNEAIGLNFLDVYYRKGVYKAQPPFVPGHEGAGIVEAVGEGVADFAPGDRVAYADPIGAYAERLIRPAGRLVKLPGGLATRDAAAILLKGMTAEYLLRRTHEVAPGETILVHAAAGGVGQLLCRWAAHLGATVIGTVGSEAKRPIAEAAGCHHVIVTDSEDFTRRVREITSGEGVRVVYDGVGAATFMGSLDCLAPLGLMVAFGNASGPVPPFDVLTLSAKGSLFMTRPTLNTYNRTSALLRQSAGTLFEAIASGAVEIAVNQEYPLREAGRAHADLEARKLTGSTILVP